MTRTRTQTALTKLATMVANVHGELAFIEVLGATALSQEQAELLAHRRAALEAAREALYATLKQFDPELDPGSIGGADGWRKRFGRVRSPRAMELRYRASLSTTSSAE